MKQNKSFQDESGIDYVSLNVELTSQISLITDASFIYIPDSTQEKYISEYQKFSQISLIKGNACCRITSYTDPK